MVSRKKATVRTDRGNKPGTRHRAKKKAGKASGAARAKCARPSRRTSRKRSKPRDDKPPVGSFRWYRKISRASPHYRRYVRVVVMLKRADRPMGSVRRAALIDRAAKLALSPQAFPTHICEALFSAGVPGGVLADFCEALHREFRLSGGLLRDAGGGAVRAGGGLGAWPLLRGVLGQRYRVDRIDRTLRLDTAIAALAIACDHDALYHSLWRREDDGSWNVSHCKVTSESQAAARAQAERREAMAILAALQKDTPTAADLLADTRERVGLDTWRLRARPRPCRTSSCLQLSVRDLVRLADDADQQGHVSSDCVWREEGTGSVLAHMEMSAARWRGSQRHLLLRVPTAVRMAAKPSIPLQIWSKNDGACMVDCPLCATPTPAIYCAPGTADFCCATCLTTTDPANPPSATQRKHRASGRNRGTSDRQRPAHAAAVACA